MGAECHGLLGDGHQEDREGVVRYISMPAAVHCDLR